jgi:hypothetical protein
MTPPRYRSNLQKGGALLDAAAILVAAWDEERPVEANVAAIVDANLFGNSSAVRRKDLVDRILKPRYIDPGPHVIGALRVLLDGDRRAFRDACYFETTRAEPLLAAFVEQLVFEWYVAGRSTLTAEDATRWLAEQEAQGLITAWSDAVRSRVARALLAALRDFGVLSGVRSGTRKEIGQPYPSVGGFTYVCWRLQEMGVTAATLEVAPAWRRWLLTPDDVASLMADLAQHGVIGLNRAGSMVRIEWRASSLTEAVHAAA